MKPETPKRRPRILVVDDDPGLLRLLTIRLRAENYEVEAVDSGVTALAAAGRFRPDLVLSDLRMEPMDGIALLREMQTRWPGVKLILLTAHGTIPDAVQATQLGAFSFLTKPVEKQELLAQVERALRVSGFSSNAEEWRAGIITRSALLEEKLAQAHMVAGTDQPAPDFLAVYRRIRWVPSLSVFTLPFISALRLKYTVSPVRSKHTGPSWYSEESSLANGSGACSAPSVLRRERRMDMAGSFSWVSVTFFSPALLVEMNTMPSS